MNGWYLEEGMEWGELNVLEIQYAEFMFYV